MPNSGKVACTVRIDAECDEALAQFRREQDDLPTRPKAIETILRDWLETSGYLTPSDDDENIETNET